MTRRLLTFTGCLIALWLLGAAAAYALGGGPGVVRASVAAGLCGAPALITLVLVELLAGSKPELKLLLLFGGVPVRMIPALGGGWYLLKVVPALAEGGDFAFWGWVVIYYIATLVVEVIVVAARTIKTGAAR